MLTPDEWSQISDQAVKIYSDLELEIIQEIAERIANFNYANTVVQNSIKIAEEMGLMYEDIINLVAKYNSISENRVREIFESAGIKSLKFDDEIYKIAGVTVLPIKQSESFWKLLEAMVIRTNFNLNNLVLTTANTVQTDFYNAVNQAYMEVSTGLKSYTQAIGDAVEKVSKTGAIIEYPSGVKRSLESAVRMNILTSVNQTCGELQEMRAKEVGWDLMEITAHSGARPSHAEWQGKIVSLSGKRGYLSKSDIGYGTATGFKGVNCRHDWFPYYKGSSKTYTNKELNKLKNEKVQYNGKKISLYDATQIQRRYEREIRNVKKEIVGKQAILTSKNKEIDIKQIENDLKMLNAKKSQKTQQLDSLLKQTNFRKDYSRLKI